MYRSLVWLLTSDRILSTLCRAGHETMEGWESGMFDRNSWTESQAGWARTVVTGRARLGGIPVGVIAVETQVSCKPGSRRFATDSAEQCSTMDVSTVAPMRLSCLRSAAAAPCRGADGDARGACRSRNPRLCRAVHPTGWAGASNRTC